MALDPKHLNMGAIAAVLLVGVLAGGFLGRCSMPDPLPQPARVITDSASAVAGEPGPPSLARRIIEGERDTEQTIEAPRAAKDDVEGFCAPPDTVEVAGEAGRVDTVVVYLPTILGARSAIFQRGESRTWAARNDGAVIVQTVEGMIHDRGERIRFWTEGDSLRFTSSRAWWWDEAAFLGVCGGSVYAALETGIDLVALLGCAAASPLLF